MKLLYSKRSPYARKAHIMALEKNIALELVEVDLTNKSADLIKANPLGKIPVLILDNGESLCDSPVICEYLDALKPPPMIPQDKKKRLRTLHLCAIADGLMDAAVAGYMEKVRHPEYFNADFIAAQEKTISQGLKFFEDHLEEIADFNLAAIAVICAIGYINFRLPHAGPSGKFPKLAKWYDEFSQRPSMEATKPG